MHLKLKGKDCSEDKGENDRTSDECVYRYQLQKVWMDSSGLRVESYGGAVSESF